MSVVRVVRGRPVRAVSEASAVGRQPCRQYRFRLWVLGYRVCVCGFARQLHGGEC
jgi:hypothetical protein